MMNKGKKRADKIANVKERERDKIGARTKTNQMRTKAYDDLVFGTSDQNTVNLLCRKSYGIGVCVVFLCRIKI